MHQEQVSVVLSSCFVVELGAYVRHRGRHPWEQLERCREKPKKPRVPIELSYRSGVSGERERSWRPPRGQKVKETGIGE